jgi:colanic acid/amylovoran biosynthesis protein
MKILLINAYSYKNLGDSGIVVAMMQFLNELYDSPEISVMSNDYLGNEEFYSALGAKSVAPPWNISHEKNKLEKLLGGLRAFLGIFIHNYTDTFKYFKEADVTISVGGGYLYSSPKGPLGFGMLNVLFNLWLATKFSKKSIGFPQSIGPFRYKVDYNISMMILKKLDRLYVRENITDAAVVSEENVLLYPDFALSLKANEKRPLEESIGVTVLDWRFARANSKEADINIYLEKIAESLISFIGNSDLHVKVYPQVDVACNDSDVAVSKKLVDHLHALGIKSSICSLSNKSHSEIIEEYSSNKLFIASRMHSSIFAISGGVPVIGMAYQPKLIGTFKLLGMEDDCLDIETFSSLELVSKMNRLYGSENLYDYPVEEFKQDFLGVV